MKVGIKDINGIELCDGQQIIITDPNTTEILIKGKIKYVPSAFMIEREGTYDVLLFHYTEYCNLHKNNPLKIEVLESY